MFRLREIIRCEQMNKLEWIDLARDDLRSCQFLCRVYRSESSDWRAVQGIGRSLLDYSRSRILPLSSAFQSDVFCPPSPAPRGSLDQTRTLRPDRAPGADSELVPNYGPLRISQHRRRSGGAGGGTRARCPSRLGSVIARFGYRAGRPVPGSGRRLAVTRTTLAVGRDYPGRRP